MKPTYPLTSLFCLSALLPIQAQENVTAISPTTVTGEKINDKGEASVIDGEELSRRSATDLNDIFQDTPSVTVNGGRAQAQQIFVNGVESNLSNVTIDGAKQGNLFHHTGNVFVEPELLKQVSVYAGAGNALQGLGALNGLIEFETKNAFDILRPDQAFSSFTKGVYYSNGEGYKASQIFAGRLGGNWAVLLSGSKTDRDEYEDGDGHTVDLTDYTAENLLLKISGRFDGGHSLDFGYEHVLNETVAYDRVNISEDFLNETGRPLGLLQPIDLGRDSFTTNYLFQPSGNDLIDLKAVFSLSTQDYHRKTSGERSELNSLSFNLRNRSELNEALSATYGFDYQNFDNDVQSLTLGKVDENEMAYGFFLQSDWQFHHTSNLSVGGRYDVYDFEDIYGENTDSDKFSPNAALTIEPTEELTFIASYAQAYRGLGIRESFLPGPRPTGLDGEEAETYKITARYEREGFFATGSYFDQSIDNYIYPISSGRGGPNGSFGDLENEGYEFGIGYQKDGFSTSLSVTDSSPEVKDYDYDDDIGIVVTGRRWILEASYLHADTGLHFGANIEHRESVDEESLAGPFPSVAAKDSYTVVNAFLNWQVQQCEGLTLSLSVDNLFDEQYADHTIYADSGLSSPGREFRLSAGYEF